MTTTPYDINVAVISLVSALRRRKNMQEQLRDLALNWSFFDAHTSASPDLLLHARSWRRLNGRTLNAEELGCYSSHYTLLVEHGRKPDNDILIVLEDDAILDTEYFNDLDALRSLMRDFGYVRLNAQLAAPSVEVRILGRRRLVRFLRKVHGSAGYMIDAHTARSLSKHLVELRRPIDIEMDRFWSHGVKIFCLYPFVLIESSASTQIGSRNYERLNLLDHLIWKCNNQFEKFRCWWENFMIRFFKSRLSSGGRSRRCRRRN